MAIRTVQRAAPQSAWSLGDRPSAALDDSTRMRAEQLGWLSLALAPDKLLLPRLAGWVIGVRSTRVNRAILRMVGAREATAGVGLLATHDPVPWLWARVGGDAMDLALLALARRSRHTKKGRATLAFVAAGAIAAVDVDTARRASKASGVAGETTRRATAAITVKRPVEDVYGYWHDLENLPRFMSHLESVQVSNGTSHWKAAGPAGRSVEWDAEITEDRPNERIAWRSHDGATVENSGVVRFRPAPGGRGTEVVVELEYAPPAGALGATVAKVLGEEPTLQIEDDLRRFKQVLETGEVVRSDGSPEGQRTQRMVLQRPAQPLP
jgi:uncharacterized membrane protein